VTKSGKAPGMDNICPEMLILDIETSVNLLHPLLTEIWKEEEEEEKKKGDITKFNNWRGITLLSIPSKLLSRILLNRIKDIAELRLRKEQATFRCQRSCVDLINTLSIILQQSNKFQTTLYLTFIDSERAFDSINRRIMWQTLIECGIPKYLLSLIRCKYDDFKCKILYEGKLADYIEITDGVRQGCILSPIIFLLVLNNVMRKTLEDRKRGIQWGMKDRLEDLDFADDTCLLSQRYSDIKAKLIRLQQEAKLAWLNINVNKTKT
jgi:hypothetical protein